MKTNLFFVPVLTLAIAALTGCDPSSSSTKVNTPSTAGTTTKTPTTTQAQVTPTPAPAAVSTPEAKAQPATIRINAGGGAVKDPEGNQWLGDTGFEGGDVIERPDVQIQNTKTPVIYQSEHYSMDSFKQKLPNGKYQVKLMFAETFEGISGPGERVFSYDVEGKPFKDFDVFKAAGGFGKAYVETVPVEIKDGQLDIKFTPQVENPQICGIEIIPAP